MANLGFTRQKAGYGGNDEYASANTPVLTGGVEAPRAPVTSQPQRGYASIGFERETTPASTPDIEAEDYESDNQSIPAQLMRASSSGKAPTLSGLSKAFTPKGILDSLSLNATDVYEGVTGRDVTGAKELSKLEKEVKKNDARAAQVEQVDFAKKWATQDKSYPEESTKAIPAPFIPQEKKDDYTEAAPAQASRGVATGLAPDEDVTDAELAEFNRVNAPKEPAKKPVEAENKPEGLFAKKESVPSKASEPERPTRDKLMKMAGINDDANQRARGLQIESQNRQKDLGRQWDEASRMAASGNILERAEGLQKRAELEREGLSRGLIQQPTGAEAAWKKFQNDPYLVKEFNKAATERESQMQAEAQAAAQEAARRDAEAKAKKDDEKFAFEKEKEANRIAEKQQEREDKFKEKLEERKNKLADIKDQREYDKERDQLNSEQRMAEFASKFSKITERGDRDQRAMLTERMYNETQQQAAQAVKAALDEAKKYTGVFGRARAFVDGKDRDAEINKVVDSYERQLNDQKKRFEEIGKIYGVKVPEVPFDRKRIEEAIKRRGPETSDDLIATFEDLAKVGEFGIKYLTPAGRAGTAFGMAANSMGGQPAPMPAPFIPQQSGINYGNLLNQ